MWAMSMRVPSVPARVATRAELLLGREPGRRWCATVTGCVAETAALVGAEDLEVLDRGRSSWMLTGRVGSVEVVLKAPIVDPVGHFDAQELLAAAGVGPRLWWRDCAVAVLERLDAVTLAEVTDPGPYLGQVAVLAAQLAELERSPASRLGSLAGWLAPRVAAAPVDFSPTSVAPSQAQRLEALELLEALSAAAEGPCHGDVNLGNVLVDSTGRVWLIDARGVLGDVHYDVAVLALKACGDRAAAVVAAGELARGAGLDPERTRGWVAVAATARV